MRPGDTQVTGVTKPPGLRTLRHSGGRPVRRGPPKWAPRRPRARRDAPQQPADLAETSTDVLFRGRAPTLVGSRSHEAGFT